jgi:ribosomal protein L11 methylase PrmA
MGTEWADYYDETNYSSIAMTHKRELVDEFLNGVNPKFVWDLGANTGSFSRISADKGIETISLDIDPAAVERNYLECKQKGETNLLPLWIDLTNPSPGIGWANQERIPLFERGPADTVLALALIHHLAISNNLPFSKIAEFLHRICKSLIIEFIPKSDSQVQKILSARKDIFPSYTQPAFEEIFGEYFTVMCCEKIRNTERTLFLMQARR